MPGTPKRPAGRIIPKTLEKMRYRTAESKLTLSQLKELKKLADNFFAVRVECSNVLKNNDITTQNGYKKYRTALDKRNKMEDKCNQLRIKYGLRTIEQEYKELPRKEDRLYFRLLKDIK